MNKRIIIAICVIACALCVLIKAHYDKVNNEIMKDAIEMDYKAKLYNIDKKYESIGSSFLKGEITDNEMIEKRMKLDSEKTILKIEYIQKMSNLK